MYKNTDNPQSSVANIDAQIINLFSCKNSAVEHQQSDDTRNNKIQGSNQQL